MTSRVAREVEGLAGRLPGSAVAGRSAEGRPLYRLALGDPRAPRASVVVAGIHAMEWIGVEAACRVAERFAEERLERRVLIYPLLNPDGAARVQADREAGRHRFRRANARGVDLNRNWPTHWKRAKGGTRLLPFLGHAGSTPASEPEVRTVLGDLGRLEAEGVAIDRALSLHSFGRMILHPYGGVWRAPRDAGEHRRAAETLAAGIEGLRYRVRQSARWVPGAFAPGMEIDHLHDRFGAQALLVELGAGGLRLRDARTWTRFRRWFYPPDAREEVERVLPALAAFVAPEQALSVT